MNHAEAVVLEQQCHDAFSTEEAEEVFAESVWSDLVAGWWVAKIGDPSLAHSLGYLAVDVFNNEYTLSMCTTDKEKGIWERLVASKRQEIISRLEGG